MVSEGPLKLKVFEILPAIMFCRELTSICLRSCLAIRCMYFFT